MSRRWSGDLVPPSRVRSVITFIDALLVQLAKHISNAVRAFRGLFGVHSKHFELLFVTREIVETVLQTCQADTMSLSLPRTKLNGFYALMLITNCWSTPVLKRLCHGKKPLERLLVVLGDIVLDFVSSIGVPVVVASGYLMQYDPISTDFSPYNLYYDDVWLLSLFNEAPIVLFGSWFDVGSRLVFSLGLLSSMDDAKALISRLPGPEKDMLQGQIVQVHSTALRVQSSHVNSWTKLQRLQDVIVQARISKWLHRIFVVWGIVISAMYLQTILRLSPTECLLVLRPWLAHQPACAIVTIDCQKHQQFSGETSDFEEVYGKLDTGSIKYVIFRNCPRVEFSPQFLTFRNLYGVKVVNSTIQIWGFEQHSHLSHPRVRFAFFVRTEFPDKTIPLGLCHKQFPRTLKDIEIAVSNIQRLPTTLPWPRGMTICIEFSQLEEFPMVLADLKPYTLSLAYNQLRDISNALMLLPDIAEFYFQGNPIDKLPDIGVDIVKLNAMTVAFELLWLSLEYTKISFLPAW